MRRFVWLLILLSVLILTACSPTVSSPSKLPATPSPHRVINAALLQGSTSGDWPMFGYDPAHTGYVDASVHPPTLKGRLLWSHKFAPIFSSPVVGLDMIYIGSTDGHLYALKQQTGAVVWRVLLGGHLTDTTPTLAGQVLLVAVRGTALEALNAYSGQVYWTYDVGEKIQAPPLAVGKRVLIASRTTLWVLDISSGGLLWKFHRGASAWPTTSSPSVVGNTVYAGLGSDSHLWALRLTDGHILWSFDTGDRITSTVVASSDTVYGATWHGVIFALNRINGTKRWSYSLNIVPEKTIIDGVGSNMALAENRLYVGDYRGSVFCLDVLHGKVFWHYVTGAQVLATPIVATHLVYIGSDDGYFYALDTQTGRPSWRYATGEIRSSASIANAHLYVGSLNGMMYAFS